jgi:hypothetical protein
VEKKFFILENSLQQLLPDFLICHLQSLSPCPYLLHPLKPPLLLQVPLHNLNAKPESEPLTSLRWIKQAHWYPSVRMKSLFLASIEA